MAEINRAEIAQGEINLAQIVRELNRAGAHDQRSLAQRQVDPEVVRQQVAVVRLRVTSATLLAFRDPSSRTCDRGQERALRGPESIVRKSNDRIAPATGSAPLDLIGPEWTDRLAPAAKDLRAQSDPVFPTAKFPVDQESGPAVPSDLTDLAFQRASAPVVPTGPADPVKANVPSAPIARVKGNAQIDPARASALAVPENDLTDRIDLATVAPTTPIAPGTTA
ncbi:MAG: hypothetical protein L3J81_06375, partial [Thermoplasmata archaeon]|nr:hypothetical protein [Thermoplasmata archaeon]